VPGFPQPAAIFRPRRPLEGAAAVLGGNSLHHFRLFPDAGLRAVELEEKRRRGLESLELRITDAHVHLRVVQKLDAGDRNADLHRDDHRVDRRLQVRKLADRRADRLRNSIEPELDFSDDPERALGADE